jgi:hypothetical protein
MYIMVGEKGSSLLLIQYASNQVKRSHPFMHQLEMQLFMFWWKKTHVVTLFVEHVFPALNSSG